MRVGSWHRVRHPFRILRDRSTAAAPGRLCGARSRSKGEPVLLLHGGLFHTEMFGPMLTALAKRRQGISVDLHGHGHTALGGRTISPIDMGDNRAQIVKQLGQMQVAGMG
jgi:pimeloyl-ACP methyl ester carboxylesterase